MHDALNVEVVKDVVVLSKRGRTWICLGTSVDLFKKEQRKHQLPKMVLKKPSKEGKIYLFPIYTYLCLMSISHSTLVMGH